MSDSGDGAVDQIKSDLSKSLRIDYPDESTETVMADEDGLLWGKMNGNGPLPLAENDVRTVCEKYAVTVRNVRTFDVEAIDE